MAFIVKKTIHGREYYYLNENKRVNGKVKTKTIAYLGKDKKQAKARSEEIIKNMKSGKEKQEKNVIEDKKKDKNEKIEIKMAKKEAPVAEKVESTGKEIKEVQSFVTKVPNESKEFTSFVQEGGFIWGPEPEIYGGVAGFYTYGPIGKLLKNKVENSVRKVFNSNGFRELEGPTVMPDVVWKASGHLNTFTDPVIKTKDGKENYRVDKLLEENGIEVKSQDKDYLLGLIKKNKIKAPNGKELAEKIEYQSLMMKTNVAGVDASLRPETATVTYLPFLRLWNYFRKKLPFAVYQIGKAYRNEISPRQNVIRGREFTQAEGQIFVDPLKKNDWPEFNEIKNEKIPLWSSKNQKSEKEWTETKVGEAFETGLVKSKAYAWCLWLCYKQIFNF